MLPENPQELSIYCQKLSHDMYPSILKKIFKLKTKKELNLDNPKTFNEKIQWLKLYDVSKEKTDWADKITAFNLFKDRYGKDFLKERYGVYNSFDEIDFNNLPEKFCLKANHGSDMNYFCKNKTELLKNKEELQKLKQLTNSWLERNFAFEHGFEMHYKDIKPRLFAEEFINSKDPSLREYSFFCFNGEPLYVQPRVTTINEEKTQRPLGLYNIYWQKCDFDTRQQLLPIIVTPPLHYRKMLEISTELCKEFKFVRVDFIENNNKLYFSELTFTPYSGYYIFSPEKYNVILGEKLKLK